MRRPPVNVVVVIGTPLLEQELAKRFTSVKTSLGEPIDIVLLDKSDGVAHRDQNFMQHVREACIKEYFFGDARRTLSPQIQQADFDSLVIYRASESKYSTPPTHLPFPLLPFTPNPRAYELQCDGLVHWANCGNLQLSSTDSPVKRLRWRCSIGRLP